MECKGEEVKKRGGIKDREDKWGEKNGWGKGEGM